jgi:hypothetical protein|tara:strand:+ start:1067 stop:1309 length:243 start_codon:yes stop_codon:yes gene_type:complete
MKITNNEYDIIINALKIESLRVLPKYQNEIEALRHKIIKEYSRIAEKNTQEGMTPEEEEIYPSRLNTEYGGDAGGGEEME